MEINNNNSDNNSNRYEEDHMPSWTPLLLLFPPVLPFFYNYKVIYENNTLTFGYSTSLSSRTINKEDISELEECEIHGFTQWGGWGIRGHVNTVGYIAENGLGIKFLDNKTGTRYTFSCKDPKKLIEVMYS